MINKRPIVIEQTNGNDREYDIYSRLLKERIIENQQNLESLKNRKELILSNRELSKERAKKEFILKHLRNSLVHGNAELPTNIDFNNLNNTYIQFYDYDTDKEKNNEKTFYAKIKIVELIDMLSKHETINNLYKVRNILR